MTVCNDTDQSRPNLFKVGLRILEKPLRRFALQRNDCEGLLDLMGHCGGSRLDIHQFIVPLALQHDVRVSEVSLVRLSLCKQRGKNQGAERCREDAGLSTQDPLQNRKIW